MIISSEKTVKSSIISFQPFDVIRKIVDPAQVEAEKFEIRAKRRIKRSGFRTAFNSLIATRAEERHQSSLFYVAASRERM